MLLAFTLAALTLTGRIRLWEIIVLATLLGIVNAFDVPARQSFLIEMVGREDLLNAIALNSSMFNGARVAGPAIAGLLVAWIGEGWCFFANGVSYLAVIAGLLMMRIKKIRAAHDGVSPIEKLREGFRFVRHTTPIRALLMLVALVSFMALPFSVLMPIFAGPDPGRGRFGLRQPDGRGGSGRVVRRAGARDAATIARPGKFVAYSAMGLGLSLILFSASRLYWVSLAALVLAGFTMMMQFTSTNTLIQAMVPDRLRGRVMSLYSMMFLGMAPIGSLLAGAIADRVGAPITVAMGGLASFAGGLVFARKWPAMRAPARELVAAQGMVAPTAPPNIPRRLREAHPPTPCGAATLALVAQPRRLAHLQTISRRKHRRRQHTRPDTGWEVLPALQACPEKLPLQAVPSPHLPGPWLVSAQPRQFAPLASRLRRSGPRRRPCARGELETLPHRRRQC